MQTKLLIAALCTLGTLAARADDALAAVPTTNDEILRATAAAPLAMQFHGSTPADLSAWQQSFAAKLNELVGPSTPPKQWTIKTLSTREFPDYTREELLLEAADTQSLPLYVLRPKRAGQTRFPILLCLHGHGDFGNDSVAGVDDTPERQKAIRQSNYDYGRQMVHEGYLAVVPCFNPFGRRCDPALRASKTDACGVEFIRLQFLGRTLIGENLRDAKWALDYACARDDARPDRIGCIGLSYGGRMTMLVTALDPRVRVAVISGALNLFQERIEESAYACGAQVIPGLLKYGDTPEIGSLIAPRPAIWEVGRRDPLIPPAWAEKAAERLQRAYNAAGMPANLQIHHHDGGHVWVGDTAVPLLAKLLKGE
ncbi:hypothetical protein CfE428DRAFT_3577 [Chthoniobacter flavus Ellin428]|uniref:Uncharacterized protein n=1 Tax=Chthoniobacter flavus Ellin428 TaxID=497964 RepID=B4D3T9_9BACT|nr:alpha/beta hydrolase family protein [Chthoniobacter flavus]EDY18919.1 hypothetical protein CfE428DRAFT_3577 [Chthoniobacter flavus Ellin428]TCO93506.1 dienelactone hydrolase [Chthoniobacter flavus]